MIKIDEELKALIPPLASEEFNQLEQNILNEGIREPIIVWPCDFNDGDYYEEFIVDGHNRFEIANKHGLEYEITQKEFDSRKDVIEWMILNQFGRRNLSAYQRSLLALKLKPVFEEKAKENKIASAQMTNEKLGNTVSQKSEKPLQKIDTQKELSKIANVSHDTIAKVQKIEEKAPLKVKEKLATGDISINKGHEIIKAIEKIPVDKVDKFVEKAIEEKQSINKIVQDIKREEKKEELEYLEPPKGKYKVIYADPPWSYGDKRAPSTGGCEEHYITMSLKDICDMPIQEIAEDDSVLFLWATSPLIQEGLDVSKSWGFKYKAMFIWDKVKHNMGHYNSVRHEILLICTKGSCTPQNVKLFDSVQSIERTNKHSQKPEEFREIIDTLYPNGNRIELFSRTKAEGWDVWGNQL